MSQRPTVRTARPGGPPPAPTVTSPSDRRAQVLEAAAIAFSRRGYAAVSLADIAAVVGISAPALYRHFPGKYALFAEAALIEMTTLVESAQSVPDPLDLRAVLRAVTMTTIAHRAHGSLYRWEARFLQEPELGQLRTATRRMRAAVSGPLRQRRTELSERDAVLLAAAALAVVASVSDHRTTTADPAELVEVIAGLAMAVLDTPLPPAPTPLHTGAGAPEEAEPPWRVGLEPTSMRERLITEAVKAFEVHGYLGATLEAIGGAVGLSASAVYRYVPTKAALLAAAFTRTQIQLAAVTSAALAEATSADDALDRLAAAYVLLWFQHPGVFSLWGSESGHLTDDERAELHLAQRDHVEVWMRVATALDPGQDPVERRLRVQAALTIVADTGRLTRFDARPEARARVAALARAAITGPS